MQKWEYKVTGHLKDQQLNELGLEGWELVAVQADGYYMWFKRPKQ